ncbi:MAG: histidine--tRNA ligase [Lactobacillales bacterium]|nr:histidine--tRNA ligase [Lactobacillales bacterium]
MIQKPKGTYDVFGSYGKNIKYVEKIIEALMQKYNYEYVRTPIFESSNLFHRGVGETSDIVSKETYDFIDRGDRNMTLRPEGTAGVVRSYIENKRYGEASCPIKNWYYGPMYRYERPQSGRFREFYQFGVEVFGSSSPMLDAEVISIPVNLYRILGLKGIKVKINSLGDTETRNNYKEALLNHFKPYLDTLCSDCKERYLKNPLRILDCKVDHDLECMKTAPKIIDYLTEESRKHFDKVQEYLSLLGIDYEVDPNVVRGLDYYTNTVFEVEADIKDFGSNNVLCGGGRYDKLVEILDGPETKAVGFALGFERLLNALEKEEIKLDVDTLDIYIIPMSEKEQAYSYTLCQDLRMNGFSTDIDYMNRNIKGNFKQADRLEAKYIIIIGEEELNNKVLTIKDNRDKKEYKVKEEELIEFLDEVMSEH